MPRCSGRRLGKRWNVFFIGLILAYNYILFTCSLWSWLILCQEDNCAKQTRTEKRDFKSRTKHHVVALEFHLGFIQL